MQCAAQPDALWVQHHGGIYRSVDGGRQWLAVPADFCRIPVNGQMVVTRTDDGGQSFQTFGDGLPGAHAYHLVYRHGLAVSADGRTLAMASITGGLWVSTDAGERWVNVSNDLPPVAALRFA